MDFSELLAQLPGLGWGLIGLWLFIGEQKRHEDTRQSYRADLREIAGMAIGDGLVHQREVSQLKKVSNQG